MALVLSGSKAKTQGILRLDQGALATTTYSWEKRVNLTISKVPSMNHSSEFLRMLMQKGDANIHIFPIFGGSEDYSSITKSSPLVVV